MELNTCIALGPKFFLLFGIVPIEAKLLNVALCSRASSRHCIHSCVGKLVINLGWCIACCDPAGSPVE